MYRTDPSYYREFVDSLSPIEGTAMYTFAETGEVLPGLTDEITAFIKEEEAVIHETSLFHLIHLMRAQQELEDLENLLTYVRGDSANP